MRRRGSAFLLQEERASQHAPRKPSSCSGHSSDRVALDASVPQRPGASRAGASQPRALFSPSSPPRQRVASPSEAKAAGLDGLGESSTSPPLNRARMLRLYRHSPPSPPQSGRGVLSLSFSVGKSARIVWKPRRATPTTSRQNVTGPSEFGDDGKKKCIVDAIWICWHRHGH